VQTNGNQTGMFLMWGYEGKELEDIEATVEHVRQSKPDVFFTTVSYPIRGTPYHIYNRVASRLVNIGQWEQATDPDFRIRGRHSRRFYRHADDLLRSTAATQPDGEKIAAAHQGLARHHAGDRGMTVAAAGARFDKLAERYDALWSESRPQQRAAVWRPASGSSSGSSRGLAEEIRTAVTEQLFGAFRFTSTTRPA
jgi:hypothetical protein